MNASLGTVLVGTPQISNIKSHSPTLKSEKLVISYETNIVSGNMILEVYNLRGERLMSKTYTAGNIMEIITKGMAPGIYYYTLRYEGDSRVKASAKTFVVVK